jgi:hypothetical protein
MEGVCRNTVDLLHSFALLAQTFGHALLLHGRLMHQSGRLALIKSILAAMPVYVTISVTLPGWLIKALEKIMK